MFGRNGECDCWHSNPLAFSSLRLTTQVLADLHSRGGRSFGDLKPENVIVAGKKLVLIDWCSSRDEMQGDLCCCDLSAAAKQLLYYCAGPCCQSIHQLRLTEDTFVAKYT